MAGILLHITSLPGSEENGDFGESAFRFVDFLSDSGIKIWQVLPLGPTMSDNSPYQSISAHAGNTELISLDEICKSDWIDCDFLKTKLGSLDVRLGSRKNQLLKIIFEQYKDQSTNDDKEQLETFVEDNDYWLADYSLFVACKTKYHQRGWADWPEDVAKRNTETISALKEELSDEINFVNFVQYVFFKQWLSLKHYANERNIQIFGDLPLFVSHDSADVWANPHLFKIDERGQPKFVAGVPPDYFSETGQRWGNPVYDWPAHEATGFSWWIERMKTQFILFDYVRIDHFRGLESYWEIPAEEETALIGLWCSAPGEKMLNAVKNAFHHDLPLIAEDLGDITPAVIALKEQFNLPGMKILQFAFGGNADNPYLPHNHEVNSVVYTGTHDNNTTLGWFSGLSNGEKALVYRYFGENHESIPELLIRCAFASVANLAIIPLQDCMSLGEKARMNVPGTLGNNWSWRFSWEDLDQPTVITQLRVLCQLYDR